MNPIILPPVGQTDFFRLRKATSLGEFKPVKLRLKNLPCVISYPSGGVSKYEWQINLHELSNAKASLLVREFIPLPKVLFRKETYHVHGSTGV